MPYDPLLRGRITIDVVSWDGPGGVAMLATTTPQVAITRALLRPSDCEILVLILWSRLGTPLPQEYRRKDGTTYSSGTIWEYEDALTSNGKPEILVYRRTSEAEFNPESPEYEERLLQHQQVERFFESFRNADGSLRGGYNTYWDAGEFGRVFELHAREVINRLLKSAQQVQPQLQEPRRFEAAMPRETKAGQATEIWTQICLPSSAGLRALLPESHAVEEEVSAEDVKEGQLPVHFLRDADSGTVFPAHLLVDTVAPGFTPEHSTKEVLLSHSSDSGVIVFTLTPTGDRARGRIYVNARQQVDGSGVFTLGSLVLVTRITTDMEGAGAVDPVWTLVNRLLTAQPSGPGEGGERLHLELKVVEDIQKKRIEKYLKLDVPLLCSLLPNYTRNNVYNMEGQIGDGERIFQELTPLLQELLCRKWHLCEKLAAGMDIDEIALVATIADIIAPAVSEIPPPLIAAIIVKRGVQDFCKCKESI